MKTTLLTPRERALLQMLADGKLRVEIRALTGSKRVAMEMRLNRLKAALNARSLAHAIAIALREGWIK